MQPVNREQEIKKILSGLLTEIQIASEQASAAIKIIREKQIVNENELEILLKHSAAADARFKELRRQIDSL